MKRITNYGAIKNGSKTHYFYSFDKITTFLTKLYIFNAVIKYFFTKMIRNKNLRLVLTVLYTSIGFYVWAKVCIVENVS